MADFLSQNEINALLDVAEESQERNEAGWRYQELTGREGATYDIVAQYWYDKCEELKKVVDASGELVNASRILLKNEFAKD